MFVRSLFASFKSNLCHFPRSQTTSSNLFHSLALNKFTHNLKSVKTQLHCNRTPQINSTASNQASSATFPSLSARGIKDVARKKLKSHSGSKKRFRFTANGRIFRKRPGLQHKTGLKPGRVKSRLAKLVEVHKGWTKHVKRALPYAMKFR
jgi:large subunit ribosomal protein L35